MEIKATDLRIGNWVQQSPINIPFKVTANLIADMQNSNIGIVGIPLTEELLLKMGFECTNFHFYTRSDMGSIYLRSPFSNANRYYVKTNEGSKLGLVRHVHGLQNWYYILSGGQELTLS